MDDQKRRQRILEAAESREADRRRVYAEAAEREKKEKAATPQQTGHFLDRAEVAERRDLGQGKFHGVYGVPLKWG